MSSWDTVDGGLPTANQISYIREMCEALQMDYLVVAPSSFDEASEMIDEMRYELGPEMRRYE